MIHEDSDDSLLLPDEHLQYHCSTHRPGFVHRYGTYFRWLAVICLQIATLVVYVQLSGDFNKKFSSDTRPIRYAVGDEMNGIEPQCK